MGLEKNVGIFGIIIKLKGDIILVQWHAPPKLCLWKPFYLQIWCLTFEWPLHKGNPFANKKISSVPMLVVAFVDVDACSCSLNSAISIAKPTLISSSFYCLTTRFRIMHRESSIYKCKWISFKSLFLSE